MNLLAWLFYSQVHLTLLATPMRLDFNYDLINLTNPLLIKPVNDNHFKTKSSLILLIMNQTLLLISKPNQQASTTKNSKSFSLSNYQNIILVKLAKQFNTVKYYYKNYNHNRIKLMPNFINRKRRHIINFQSTNQSHNRHNSLTCLNDSYNQKNYPIITIKSSQKISQKLQLESSSSKSSDCSKYNDCLTCELDGLVSGCNWISNTSSCSLGDRSKPSANLCFTVRWFEPQIISSSSNDSNLIIELTGLTSSTINLDNFAVKISIGAFNPCELIKFTGNKIECFPKILYSGNFRILVELGKKDNNNFDYQLLAVSKEFARAIGQPTYKIEAPLIWIIIAVVGTLIACYFAVEPREHPGNRIRSSLSRISNILRGSKSNHKSQEKSLSQIKK